LRLAYSALELSPWQCGSRCGEPWTPGPSRRGPAQAFSSIAAMYPVLASATAPAISGALSTRPQRRRRRWPDSKEVSYYHRVTPCGLSNRARRTPRSWRGLPPRRSPTLGVGAFRRRGTAGFRRAACAHTGAVHGPVDPVLPRVAPALAWTLNKYTPAKGV